MARHRDGKIQAIPCTQCGAHELLPAGEGRLRCAYCGSLFAVLGRESPKVEIRKGAKVVFGRNANVEIRGGMQVQEGAQVEINGKVTVMQGGKAQPYQLKLIQKGEKAPD